MATVTIRNLEDETVERLKKLARSNNRSLEAELREILERTARRMDRETFLREAERIAQKTRHRQQTDSVDLIREDRDR